MEGRCGRREEDEASTTIRPGPSWRRRPTATIGISCLDIVEGRQQVKTYLDEPSNVGTREERWEDVTREVLSRELLAGVEADL